MQRKNAQESRFADEAVLESQASFSRTMEVSNCPQQARWSVKGGSELPPDFERRSGAAVRSTDFVGRRPRHG